MLQRQVVLALRQGKSALCLIEQCSGQDAVTHRRNDSNTGVPCCSLKEHMLSQEAATKATTV